MARVDLGTGALFAKIAQQRLADDKAAKDADEAAVQTAKNVGTGVGAVGGALAAAPWTGGASLLPAIGSILAGATAGADWGEKVAGTAAGDSGSAKGLLRKGAGALSDELLEDDDDEEVAT